MTVWYNEIDAYAAQWLRNLIAARLIPAGDVDERSIADVQPEDLAGYSQCHFFAGIAGWSEALRLANWPEGEQCWTGSCPCQSLSVAGKRKGHADERHLWPAFCRLIAECRPAAVFGEQSASKDGREWLAGVRADLEELGYACGAADLCAAGVGAPHPRQRLYWVAYALEQRREGERLFVQLRRSQQTGAKTSWRGEENLRLADAYGGDTSAERLQRSRQHGLLAQDGCHHQRLGHPQGERSFLRASGGIHREASRQRSRREASEQSGEGSYQGLGDAFGQRWEGPQDGEAARQPFAAPWHTSQLIDGPDGFYRIPIEPEFFPVADGGTARMGRIRAYGNAIVPQLAAEFIKAAQECRP